MRSAYPWNMLGIDLPPGVVDGRWIGNPWRGPNKDTHEIEGVIFFVDPGTPKPDLIGLIKDAKAHWEPSDVAITFFEQNDTGKSSALWSSGDPFMKSLGPDAYAKAWGVPREMVEDIC